LNNASKSLIVVAGPTAAGKTQMALKIARFYQTEIISADSRQMYRELNIGTAKPSGDELQKIRHHFINRFSISESYNASRFEKDGLKLIHHLFETHDTVVMAGGSGLYIHAIINGFDSMPAPDKNIRSDIQMDIKQYGKQILLDELASKDIEYFNIIDKNNIRRIIRAIEVIRISGKPYSSFRKRKTQKRAFQIICIALDPGRETLYKNINLRVDQMIKQGLEQEAFSLFKYRNLPCLDTVGYREFFDYFDQKISKEEAIRLIKRNSRRYAKRQYTWFRKNKDFVWFRPKEEQKLLDYIHQRINKQCK